MDSWWSSLTEAQGTVISGILTMIAAIGGVLIGGFIFSGKVKDIETALQFANNEIKRHLDQTAKGIIEIEARIGGLGQKISGLEEQFSATSQSLGQISANVDDLQSKAPEAEQAKSSSPVHNLETLRENWNYIRDRLEEAATDQKIDGRTRSKYTRTDRRNYYDLIKLMEMDGNLNKAALYREAYAIWQSYRTGRKEIAPHEAERLNQLRQEL